MKNIKQIREEFDLITEKEEKESRKLSTLVRAGLYDAKKLPALKKALEKSAEKMTSQEKRMLLNLLDTLINQVVSDEQIYRKVKQNVQHVNEAKGDYLAKADPRFKTGYPSEKKMPTVLILKRKAIRVYPDNQKVALYYSQALDKYVTIPFGGAQLGLNEAIDRKISKLDIKAHRELDLDSDEVDLIHKRGEHKSGLSRASAIVKRHGIAGGGIGIAAGTAINDAIKRKMLNRKVASKKSEIASRPAEKSEPAKTKVKDTKKTKTKAPKIKVKVSSPTLKMRSPNQTKTRMSAIKKKNPKATFSASAVKRAQVNEVAPLVPLAVAGARIAAPYVARAAARYAPAIGRGLASAGRTALSKGKELGKKTVDAYKKRRADKAKEVKDKTRRQEVKDLAKDKRASSGPRTRGRGNKNNKKDKKLDKTRTSLAAALGGSVAGAKPEDKKQEREFSLKPTSVSSQQYASKGNETQRMRDLSLARRSQSAMMREENVLLSLTTMVKNNIQEQTFNFDERKININNTIAKKILYVYESVNITNKKKMEKMLNESAESFNKVLSFAARQ